MHPQRTLKDSFLQHEKAFPELFLESGRPRWCASRFSLGQRALSRELLQDAAPTKPGFPVHRCPGSSSPAGGDAPLLPMRPVFIAAPTLPSLLSTPRCILWLLRVNPIYSFWLKRKAFPRPRAMTL